MHKVRLVIAAAVVLIAGCDDKNAANTAASASASAAPAPAPTPSVTASAEPAMTASAAPSASAAPGASMITGEASDRVITVREPSKDNNQTVKVAPGGTLTLFLPDYSGTVWSFDKADASLGKPKEEVIPGFAPKTNGHQFKWTGVKAGKAKATFNNKPAADKNAKPTQTFNLTVDAS